jgi:hypothetical protein
MIGGYSHSVSEKQVKYWKKNAPHILKWVDHVYSDIYDCWIDPRTKEDVNKCPWLRVYKSPRYKNLRGAHCLIHKWKDYICQGYPSSVSFALITKCKGFDHLPETQIRQMLVGEFIQQIEFLKSLKTPLSHKRSGKQKKVRNPQRNLRWKKP